jgi:single-strand DNA-binding protein
MNKWIFTGNLGKDAEQRFLPTGTAVLSFNVAVKSGFGDKAKTTWVSCALFGKQAEGRLIDYLKKGAQVAIAGEAFLDEWEKDGVNQKMLKVNVSDIDLIGGVNAQNTAQNGGNQQYNAQQNAQQRPAPQRPAPQQRPQQQNQGQQYSQQPQQQQGLPPGDEWGDQDIPF